MAAYLIQWSMILWAVENKCHYYDLMGVPGNIEDENNPIYGLYRFKKGFGGEMWEFVGEFDMVYKPFWNWGFNLVERSRKTLRHSFSRFKAGLRKRLAGKKKNG